MGGGGGGPRGPSAAETRNMMEGHWKQYQQWGADAQSSFAKTESSIKSRMAAGGVKAGSTQWAANLSKAKSDYEKTIKGIKGGATAGILKDWIADQQKQEIRQLSTSPGASADQSDNDSGLPTQEQRAERRAAEDAIRSKYQNMSMEDYLTEQFGVAELESAKEAGPAGTSEGARAGRRKQTTSATTASPWW